MKIQTKFHGVLDIQAEQVWDFPKGLPGFEDEKEFALLPVEGNDMFQVLQSTTTADIAFIVASPYTLVAEYTFEVDEPTINLLEIEKERRRLRSRRPLIERTNRHVNNQLTGTSHLPYKHKKSETNDLERQYLLLAPPNRDAGRSGMRGN